MPTEPGWFKRLTLVDINKSINPEPQWEAKRWRDYAPVALFLILAVAIIVGLIFGG